MTIVLIIIIAIVILAAGIYLFGTWGTKKVLSRHGVSTLIKSPQAIEDNIRKVCYN